MITVKGTPELAAAARATIERRLSHGGGHTGWSRAWIINMWARLHDGAKVYENISALLSHSTSINMFDMHPPFQIDGNFGGGAGIQEAVFQSCSGELMFLPALPEQWASKGEAELYARGGFKVRFFWEDGRLDSALITSLSGGKCRICGNYKVTLCGEELTDTIVSAVFADGVTEFYTEAGYEYYIEQV